MSVKILSGYFNPLHLGHIEYIKSAWRYIINEDALLFVIVNNDKQVELKNSIPCLDENTRYEIIRNLYMVDQAFTAKDQDLTVSLTLEWIVHNFQHLGPFYFFNSGDRQSSNTQEDKVCKELGIKQVFLDLPKINSSSQILHNVGEEWMKRLGWPSINEQPKSKYEIK